MSKRTNTPVIKPNPKSSFEQSTSRSTLRRSRSFEAYAEFIDSEQGYVIREALNYLFESDSTFQEFFSSRTKSESATHETS